MNRIECMSKGEKRFMNIDPMTKMWISFVAIGLMAVAAVLITFARAKTRGVVRFVLSLIAFICLILSLIYGLVSII